MPRHFDLDRLVAGESDPFEFFRYVGGAYLRETTFSGFLAGAGTQWGPAAIGGNGNPDIVSDKSALGLGAFRNGGDGIFKLLDGSADPLSGIDAGASSAPGFFDFDGDVEFDLVVRNSLVGVNAFTNTGGKFSAARSNPLAGSTFGAFPPPDFVGTPGNDNLTGTGNSDIFDVSQGGNDTVNGGSGDDGFYFGAAYTSADTVVGGAGTNDQIGLQGDYTGANALSFATAINGVEVIALMPGFDYTLSLTPAALGFGKQLTVYAAQLGPGDDFTFTASIVSGSLRVFGGLGTDNIRTGFGDDTIYFGPGAFDPTVDRVNGGTDSTNTVVLDGDYTFTLPTSTLTLIAGFLLLPGPDDDLNIYNLTLPPNLTIGGSIPSLFTVDGRAVKTSLTVEAGVDGNTGNVGHVILYGGSEADVLSGAASGDTLYGGLGGDTLKGRHGSFTAGSDTYLYNDVSESTGTAYDRLVGFNDTLTGFGDALDKIDLPFAVTGFATPQSGMLDDEVLNAVLETAFAGLGAHQAGVFTATDGDLAGHTYLVVDADGANGYQDGLDYLFEMVSPVSPIDQLSLFS